MTAGWGVCVTPPAEKDIEKLDPQVRRRVIAALDRLVADPPQGDLQKLTDQDEWRLRVGDWRVRLELRSESRLVVVHRVIPRGRAYR